LFFILYSVETMPNRIASNMNVAGDKTPEEAPGKLHVGASHVIVSPAAAVTHAAFGAQW
jgi:hypothetical protein